MTDDGRLGQTRRAARVDKAPDVRRHDALADGLGNGRGRELLKDDVEVVAGARNGTTERRKDRVRETRRHLIHCRAKFDAENNNLGRRDGEAVRKRLAYERAGKVSHRRTGKPMKPLRKPMKLRLPAYRRGCS